MSPQLAILALTLLAGLASLAIGLRGRKLDDHPHCRGCGFDLKGLTTGNCQPAEVGPRVDPPKCPECGRDLAQPGAVRPGMRVKRWRWLILGAAPWSALLIAIAFSFADSGWQARINAATPTRVLIWEVGLRAPMRLDGVMKELLKRSNASQLDRRELGDLATALARVQADPSSFWSPAWSDLIESAWAGGMLDGSLMRAYLERSMRLDIVCRRRLLEQQEGTIQGEVRFFRVGSRGVVHYQGAQEVHLVGDGDAIALGDLGPAASSSGRAGGFFVHGFLVSRLHAQHPGRQRIAIASSITFSAGIADPITLTQHVEREIEVFSEQQVRRMFRSDPWLTQWIQANIRLGMPDKLGPPGRLEAFRRIEPDSLQVEPVGIHSDDDPDFWRLTGWVRVGGALPSRCSVALHGAVCIDGIEYADASTHKSSFPAGVNFPLEVLIPRQTQDPPRQVDVTVYSHHNLPELDLEAEAYWEGAVVIPGVRLVPPPEPVNKRVLE